jgi:hypothetical protein
MKKVIRWEIENEPDYNTWEPEYPDGHGSYSDYRRLVIDTAYLVRQNLPDVGVVAGGLRAHSEQDLAFTLMKWMREGDSALSGAIDVIGVHHGTTDRMGLSLAGARQNNWPTRSLALTECHGGDVSRVENVENVRRTLKLAIDEGHSAAVLGVCSSLYRWGNPPKSFLLGAFGLGGRVDSQAFLDALKDVGNYGQRHRRSLASMWGEEYATGNESAMDFAHRYAPICRLGISTEAFDPMIDGRGWSVEACLAAYPAIATAERVSCLQVIQRARFLQVCLDGSEHGDPDGRYYHRKHLGYDPALPPEDQEWAECLAPYYHSKRVTSNLKRILAELSEYLADYEADDVIVEPGNPPIPPQPPEDELLNKEEVEELLADVEEILGACNEHDDMHKQGPKRRQFREEVRGPLRGVRNYIERKLEEG